MKRNPEKITRVHVLKAARLWDREGGFRNFRGSIKFDVEINGKAYPPKAISSSAHMMATGRALEVDEFKGAGDGIWHRTLENLGFPISLKAHAKKLANTEMSTDLDQGVQADIESILEGDAKPTEQAQLILARLGQGKFRKDLMVHWGKSCALLGLEEPTLLRASHIKRWADCKSRKERLDPDNGLLLSANIDCLFEAGMISFDDDGRLLVSKGLSQKTLSATGLAKYGKLRMAPSRKQAKYLREHRQRNNF